MFVHERREPGELHCDDWTLLFIAFVYAQWLQAVLPVDASKVMGRERNESDRKSYDADDAEYWNIAPPLS